MNRPSLGPADVRVGLGEDSHVVLERSDEVRHELDRNDHARTDRSLDDVVLLGLATFSESGMTSQNVSVKSKGVWAIEQKFA